VIETAPTRVFALLVILAVGILGTGCSTAHHARPLGKGNGAVHASIGGPVAGIGTADTPIPLTTVTGKVGVTDRLDVFAGWHVLETFLNDGNFYFDIGASYYIFDQKRFRPGLSAAFTVSPLINRESGWASFDLQITASWALDSRERHLIYVGMHNYFAPPRNQIVDMPPYTWSPYLGGQLRLGKKRRLGLTLELKWHRPYASTRDSVVGYLGPGKQGALSFVSGITVYLGRDMKPAAEPETYEGDE